MTYLLMFILGITSTTIMFPPTEVALVALAGVESVPPITKFGMTLDLARYRADLPWLLPIVAAISTNIGNSMYYLVGAGAIRFDNKVTRKIRDFDINRLGRAKEVALCTAALFSIPPVTAGAFASGVIKYGLLRYHLVTIIPKIIRYYLVFWLGRSFINVIVNVIK